MIAGEDSYVMERQHFEVFRPSWNLCKLADNDAPVNNQCGYTSFTHPWSAGVAKWLSEEVLGVKPEVPDLKTFTVCPHLTTGLTRIDGAVPTPHGKIKVYMDVKEAKRFFCLFLPEQQGAWLYLLWELQI